MLRTLRSKEGDAKRPEALNIGERVRRAISAVFLPLGQVGNAHDERGPRVLEGPTSFSDLSVSVGVCVLFLFLFHRTFIADGVLNYPRRLG